MHRNADIRERDDHVTAALNYVVPTGDGLFTYLYETPPDIRRTNARYESRPVQICDIRPFADGFSLDREGVVLVREASRVRDFYDDDEIRRVYYAEAERLIASATGAARVVVFDFARRQRVFQGARSHRRRVPSAGRRCAWRLHGEVRSATRTRVGGHGGRASAARPGLDRQPGRPMRGPLLDAPLAVTDARSIAATDLIAAELIYPNRRGENYLVAFNPAHRWLYAPAMEPSEALLFKCHDSRTDGTARFVAHSAFADPRTPADAPPRESIELRALVFHPA